MIHLKPWRFPFGRPDCVLKSALASPVQASLLQRRPNTSDQVSLDIGIAERSVASMGYPGMEGMGHGKCGLETGQLDKPSSCQLNDLELADSCKTVRTERRQTLRPQCQAAFFGKAWNLQSGASNPATERANWQVLGHMGRPEVQPAATQ